MVLFSIACVVERLLTAQFKSIPDFSTIKTPVHGESLNPPEYGGLAGIVTIACVRDFVILFVHVIVTVVRLGRPGGLRSVVAESALIRHQLLILNRGRKRAPNLRATDRIAAGLFTLLLKPARIFRSAIVFKPSTLLRIHGPLRKRKYRLLFSPQLRRRPGPKGPGNCCCQQIRRFELG